MKLKWFHIMLGFTILHWNLPQKKFLIICVLITGSKYVACLVSLYNFWSPQKRWLWTPPTQKLKESPGGLSNFLTSIHEELDTGGLIITNIPIHFNRPAPQMCGNNAGTEPMSVAFYSTAFSLKQSPLTAVSRRPEMFAQTFCVNLCRPLFIYFIQRGKDDLFSRKSWEYERGNSLVGASGRV